MNKKKKCQVMGCGGEAYSLVEFRRVDGAKIFEHLYLCDNCTERMTDRIGELDEVGI